MNYSALIAVVLLCIASTLARGSTTLTTDARVMNDANLSSMTIIGSDEDSNAYFLKAGKEVCSIRIKNGELEFAVNKAPFLSANHAHMSTSKGTVFTKGVALRDVIEINNRRQWALAYRMDHKDFNPSIIYECGIYKLIGGYKKTSSDEMTKSFALPKHSMIKIEGRFHFLDNWKGETAYIKVATNLLGICQQQGPTSSMD